MSIQQNINIINIDIIHPQATKMAQISLHKKNVGINERQLSKTGYQSAKNNRQKRSEETRTHRYFNPAYPSTPSSKELSSKRSPNRFNGLKSSTNLSTLVSHSPQYRENFMTEVSEIASKKNLSMRHASVLDAYKPLKTRCVNTSQGGTPVDKSPLKVNPAPYSKASHSSSISQTPKIAAQNQQVSNIRIFVRVRPPNKVEKEITNNQLGTDQALQVSEQKVTIPSEKMVFTFTKVFAQYCTQEMVYNDVGKETLKDVLTGYNGTILAYGPTGSGKTHSMFGVLDDNQLEGLIPRACKQIFQHIRNQPDQEFQVYCEMMEIYQESLNDLLSLDKQELKIKESPSEGVYVQGLSKLLINSESDLMEAVSLGNQAKKIKSTKINEYSSRSHTLLTVEIISRPVEGVDKIKKRGRLNLVDLAGSEKVNKSGAVGVTLEEARKINLSLSCLGNVIHALSNNSEHVPYRDSKLTRILQESLGGNYKTSMIVTCSPHSSSIEETITTLKFAIRAKSVKNYCKLNFKPCGDSMKNIVSQLSLELAQTREELSNFKLALIRIKEHIQSQNQDTIMSHEKALETVKVLDELIKRPNSSLPEQKAFEFQDIKENLSQRYAQSTENEETMERLGNGKSTSSNAESSMIKSQTESMVPLLIQVKKDQQNSQIITQLKSQVKERDDVVYQQDKWIEDLRQQLLFIDKQNVQLREENNQLKLQQTKTKMANDYNQIQTTILQQQLQALNSQLTNQEQAIAKLHAEKRELVQRSFENFLKKDLNFSEIKLVDYFKQSVNFTQNTENVTQQIQKMSLDHNVLFDNDPSGLEFKESFISQLDFEKASKFPSQDPNLVTLSLQLQNVQEREAVVYLLKNQLINAHIINQHLVRIISALEWKQLIEYGRAKLRSSLQALQRSYAAQLETVLQSTASNFALLKERIEQVELDLIRQNEKIHEKSYSSRVLQKRKKQQIDNEKEDSFEIKRILKEIDQYVPPTTFEGATKALSQKNLIIRKLITNLQKSVPRDLCQENSKFTTLQQQELNRLQNKVVLLQSELQMEACKSQQYFKAYQNTSEHLNFMKQFSQDLETGLARRLQEENDTWQNTFQQIKLNCQEELKQKSLKLNKMIEQVHCCLGSVSQRLENPRLNPEQIHQLQKDILVFRERFFLT